MKGEFDVEPGFGSEKDEFLKDHKIKTFLILDKSHQTKDYESSNINGSKSDGMVSVNEPTVILRPAYLQPRQQSAQFITSRWADKLPRLSLTKCMQDEYWKPEIPFSNVRKDHKFFWRINTGCKRRIRKTFEVKIWKKPLLVKEQTIPQQKALDLSFNLAPLKWAWHYYEAVTPS